MTDPGETAIRILVLDDHEVVRDGIISMLESEPDLQIVASARTAEDALVLFREQKPDVALVDLRLPGMSGADFIATVRQEDPDARFVVLTTFDSDEDIYRAFKVGAQAYVLKDSFRSEIVDAIRGVHAGRRIIPENLAQRLKDLEAAPPLSPREIEVLTLVARGESNKLIASLLGIGEGTIKTYLLRIYAKLEVNDRTAAVTKAIARGIVKI
jgi:two-component system, NarL family, response regulator